MCHIDELSPFQHGLPFSCLHGFLTPHPPARTFYNTELGRIGWTFIRGITFPFSHVTVLRKCFNPWLCYIKALYIAVLNLMKHENTLFYNQSKLHNLRGSVQNANVRPLLKKQEKSAIKNITNKIFPLKYFVTYKT